jgi:hypothetical protein
VAHFCDECRHFIAVSLSDDACPRCGSTEIKYAVAWMRTPGEQTERAMARRRAPLMHKAAQLIPTPRDADASTADIVSLRRKRTTER